MEKKRENSKWTGGSKKRKSVTAISAIKKKKPCCQGVLESYWICNLQTDHCEGVKTQVDTINERFTVEHIAYCNDVKTLHVWLYSL